VVSEINSYAAFLASLSQVSNATIQFERELASWLSTDDCIGFLSKSQNTNTSKSGEFYAFSNKYFIHGKYNIDLRIDSLDENFVRLDVFPIADGKITSIYFGNYSHANVGFDSKTITISFGTDQIVTLDIDSDEFDQMPATRNTFYTKLKSLLHSH
jgi:hypothetical protein